MPRVQVVVQVLDDDGSRVARSSFFIERGATEVLLEEVTPVELARDLGEVFASSFREQYPGVGFDTLPGEPQVRSDSSGVDGRLLTRGALPEVSMGAVVSEPLHLRALQAPAPPEESNPVSRRIRNALRAVVGSEGENTGQRLQALLNLYELGAIPRSLLLERMGLNESVTEEEMYEALRTRAPVRGRRTLGAIIDDDAHFDAALPRFASDQHLPRVEQNRQITAVEQLNAIYGGDSWNVLHYSGIPRESRVGEGKPPEDVAPIPTRYQRKPVI